MDSTTPAQLKPCPFCGGERIGDFHHIISGIPESWHVECLAENCGCGTCHHETRAEAIAAWNQRPAQDSTQEAESELVERLRSEIFAILRRHDVSEQCFAEVAMVAHAARTALGGGGQ